MLLGFFTLFTYSIKININDTVLFGCRYKIQKTNNNFIKNHYLRTIFMVQFYITFALVIKNKIS